MKSESTEVNVEEKTEQTGEVAGPRRVGLRGRSPLQTSGEVRAPLPRPPRPLRQHSHTAVYKASSAGEVSRVGREMGVREPQRLGCRFGRSPLQTAHTHTDPIESYKAQLMKFVQAFDSYKQMEKNVRKAYGSVLTLKQQLNEEKRQDKVHVSEIEKSLQIVFPNGISMQEVSIPPAEDIKKELQDIKANYKCLVELKRDPEVSVQSVKRNFGNDIEHAEGFYDELKRVKLVLTQIKTDISSIKGVIKTVNNKEVGCEKGDGPVGEITQAEGETNEANAENEENEFEELNKQTKINEEITRENEKLRQRIFDLENKLAQKKELANLNLAELQLKLDEMCPGSHEMEGDCGIDCKPGFVEKLQLFLNSFEEIKTENGFLGVKLGESKGKIENLEELIKTQKNKLQEQEHRIEVLQKAESNRTVNEAASSELQQELKQLKETVDQYKTKICNLYSKYKPLKLENKTLKKKLDSYDKRSWLKKFISI